MARVKIGRCGCLRLSGVPGITAEMGIAGLLRLNIAEVQAAQDEQIPASRNVCEPATGFLARVVKSSAVRIAPHSKNSVGMGKLCGAFVNLKTADARMRLNWRASVTIWFDSDLQERSLRSAAARAASQRQQIGFDHTMAGIAGELAAIQVV